LKSEDLERDEIKKVFASISDSISDTPVEEIIKPEEPQIKEKEIDDFNEFLEKKVLPKEKNFLESIDEIVIGKPKIAKIDKPKSSDKDLKIDLAPKVTKEEKFITAKELIELAKTNEKYAALLKPLKETKKEEKPETKPLPEQKDEPLPEQEPEKSEKKESVSEVADKPASEQPPSKEKPEKPLSIDDFIDKL